MEVVKAVEQLEIKLDGPAFFSCSILFDKQHDDRAPLYNERYYPIGIKIFRRGSKVGQPARHSAKSNKLALHDCGRIVLLKTHVFPREASEPEPGRDLLRNDKHNPGREYIGGARTSGRADRSGVDRFAMYCGE